MEKKVIHCNCAKCHEWFDFTDADQINTYHYGVPIVTKVCPYCGSGSWTSSKDETYFDKYDKSKYIQRNY